MAAKTFDSWAYETFEKLGTNVEAITRLAWNAATEAAVERFASTKKQSMPCSKCGTDRVLMCPNRKCEASPFNKLVEEKITSAIKPSMPECPYYKVGDLAHAGDRAGLVECTCHGKPDKQQ